MTASNQLAEFHGQQLTIIDHSSRKWLTAEQIGQALGYAPEHARDSITKLYRRHADEFSEADTFTVKLTANSRGNPNTRIFSDTGCIKLGFFANTPRAKEFRTWASQVLANKQDVKPATHWDLADLSSRTLAIARRFMDVMSVRRAYEVANRITQLDTGINVLAELGIDPAHLDDTKPWRTALPTAARNQLNDEARLVAYVADAKSYADDRRFSNELRVGMMPWRKLFELMGESDRYLNKLIRGCIQAQSILRLQGEAYITMEQYRAYMASKGGQA